MSNRQRLTVRLAAAADTDKRKKKDTRRQDSGEVRRNLDGFDYDPSKANVLKKALHNINVSLGTLLAASKELAMLRGSDITPDGKLGGRGFIMDFRDIKSMVNEAAGNLSDITDTLADELTNPKWNLSTKDKKKVKDVQEDVEEKVEEIEEVMPENGEPSEEKETPESEAPPPPIAEEEAEGEEVLGPDDVRDSAELEALRRYQSCIEGNIPDKVASVLGKTIMANLSKGDI